MITLTGIETPLGVMLAGATPEGVCLLEFTGDRQEREVRELETLLDMPSAEGKSDLLETLRSELAEYFAGETRSFSTPLVAPGTPFQEAAWKELLNIPYGTTRSYKEQAAALDRPNAVRAVATANSRNRISIIIPCHRVIGADGNLTGYGGGLWRKQRLLELEQEVCGQKKLFDLR